MGYYRLWVITVWVISGLTVCVIRVGRLKMLWVITGYGLAQYGLSQV